MHLISWIHSRDSEKIVLSIHFLSSSILKLNLLGYYKCLAINVCELMGRVHNVILIKCMLDPGKPQRGWDFEREGTWAE